MLGDLTLFIAILYVCDHFLAFWCNTHPLGFFPLTKIFKNTVINYNIITKEIIKKTVILVKKIKPRQQQQ